MGRDEVRSVQLELSSIIKDKYIACRKLGEGGCGVIYELARLDSPNVRLACKAELVGESKEEEILRMEARVMRKLNENKAKHSGICVEEGRMHNYNYLIMTLLGPSLSDLRKMAPDMKFTMFTCVAVTIQCLDALREVHEAGYVHRDVKPSNFAIGELGTSRERLVHVLDFGLCRYFWKEENGKKVMRGPRKTVPFRGTTRYCSTNAHSREEQGRHDDLWSLMYMLIEMYTGDLPWRNMDREQTERCKISNEPELLKQCPHEFELAIAHIKSLTYACTPNYTLLRNIFCQLYHKRCEGKMTLDWEMGGCLEKEARKTVQLPTVYKQNTEKIVLADLLEIPKSVEDVQSMTVTKGVEKASLETNSSHDDTLDDSEKAKPPKASHNQSKSLKYGKTKSMQGAYVYQRNKPTAEPNKFPPKLLAAENSIHFLRFVYSTRLQLLMGELVQLKDGEKVGDWEILKKLGEGGFGAVYLCKNKEGAKYALKVEAEGDPIGLLKMEVYVLMELAKTKFEARHFLGLMDRGQKPGKFNYVVMTLVGESLQDLRLKAPMKKFSIGTAISVGKQCLEALEDLHNVGILHRDIKPGNYTVGRKDMNELRKVYMLDFGMARKFIKEDGTLRNPRAKAGFRGTVKYAPLACHVMREQCRKDDIESWMYMVIELTSGKLPWRNLTESNDVGMFKKDCKTTRYRCLFGNCPREFLQIFPILDKGKFFDAPDYPAVYKLLEDSLESTKAQEFPYDWEM